MKANSAQRNLMLSGILILICVMLLSAGAFGQDAGQKKTGFMPGERALLEAHNCYPYLGKWSDRLSRALSTGFPVGIEIDLAPKEDKKAGTSTLVAAHGVPVGENAPTIRDYFFEVVRPVMEKALNDGNKGDWPLITLNVNDIRTLDTNLYVEFWNTVSEYKAWLSTAPKSANPDEVTAITPGPLLVLTNSSKCATDVFYDRVAVGAPLLVFGVASDNKATNYKRWQNHSWGDVEPEGQPKAGDWTEADAARLKTLVQQAHAGGLWIRFYALDGFSDDPKQGWGKGYNFGSLEAVQSRWKAAIEAGVDYIATDQCEEFAKVRK
jgi:hypothetical protein